ncbi:MAG: protein phosphatase 2C domain-containing protein [Alphaproteobacteria bacterium]|nr:protein phosphatase 2C domain-containing protein [Alphaproteobacteria bacterium]
MLTLLDAISAGGDRAGQNDDAFGAAPGAAWVIDGATDLDAPLTPTASDAAWIARAANAWLCAQPAIADADPVSLVRAASTALREGFAAHADPETTPHWRWPLAALLLVQERGDGVVISDLGDCRLFTHDGAVHGGRARGKDEEHADAAAHAADGGGTRYKSADALAFLRAQRGAFYADSAPFGIDPRCADALRVRTVPLERPTHLLLATDGFAALSDVYGAYDPGGLVRAAVAEGLAPLLTELRAIETADRDGARHPRWKRSDDATAVLLRLD